MKKFKLFGKKLRYKNAYEIFHQAEADKKPFELVPMKGIGFKRVIIQEDVL